MGLGRGSAKHRGNAGGSAPTDARAAISELFDAHAAALHSYVSGRTGPTVADDVVSETFVIAFRGWNSFDEARGTARAWLFGIATNQLRHHWRSQERHLAAVAQLIHEMPTPDTSDQTAERIDAAAVVRQLMPALTRLNQLDLDILLLNAWAGLQPAEIAAALGVPGPTVRTKLRRTRQQLRASILLENSRLVALPIGDPDAF